LINIHIFNSQNCIITLNIFLALFVFRFKLFYRLAILTEICNSWQLLFNSKFPVKIGTKAGSARFFKTIERNIMKVYRKFGSNRDEPTLFFKLYGLSLFLKANTDSYYFT